MRDALAQDLKYAVRLLRRSPAFSLTAVLSLAIGIGPNAAIFSVVNAVALKPLPGISGADELVDIGRTQDGSGFDNMSYPNYVDLRDRNDVFTDVAAYRLEPQPMSLTEKDGGGAERIFSQTVSGNYFSVLGVTPAHGRFFAPDEDRVAGERRAVVLSERLWTRRFNRDPSIVGRSLVLNGQDHAVVGVAAARFHGTSFIAPDVWVPIHASMAQAMLDNRRAVWMLAVGRLKPGGTLPRARDAVTALGVSLERAYPELNQGKAFTLVPSKLVPGELAQPVYAFLGLLGVIVGVVLLIACVNLAGMLLARATARRREIGVRLAMGASRSRLVRQFVTEALLLFAAGGVLGVALGRWLVSLLLALVPQLPVPIELDLAFDARVALFTAVLAIISGTASGLLPALQATRADLVPALKDEAGAGRGVRLRLRSALVVAQVALSLLLLVGATLFVRSLQHAASIDTGFDSRHVELASLDLRLAGYDDKQGVAFTYQLLDRVAALPHVTSASVALSLPLGGGGWSFGGVSLPSDPDPLRGARTADWNVISPSYFDTLRIPIVRGRRFDARDRAGAPLVAIVNETMARRLWPARDPVGQRFFAVNPGARQEIEVVGVARDSKYRSLGESPRLFVYVPIDQQYNPRANLLVRTDGTMSAVPAVREVVRSLNPNLPVVSAQTLDEYMSVGLLPQRVLVWLAGSLGVVGLLLAAVGVYGITAYAVSRRTREIGIRLALGADQSSVLRLMVWQGMVLVTGGLAIGIVAALGLTRLVSGLLYGITPSDPLSYGLTLAVFVAITLAASYVPARRAASIDPTLALRAE